MKCNIEIEQDFERVDGRLDQVDPAPGCIMNEKGVSCKTRRH